MTFDKIDFNDNTQAVLRAVKEALKDGSNPASHDNRAFIQASKFGHLKVVKILLSDKRVDPYARANAAMDWAVTLNEIYIVEELLKNKNYKVSEVEVYIVSNIIHKNNLTKAADILISDKNFVAVLNSIKSKRADNIRKYIKEVLNIKKLGRFAKLMRDK